MGRCLRAFAREQGELTLATSAQAPARHSGFGAKVHLNALASAPQPRQQASSDGRSLCRYAGFVDVGGARLPKRVAGRLIASSTSLVLPVAARTSETDGDLRGRRVTGRVSLIRAYRYQAPAPAEAHYFDFPYCLTTYILDEIGERCESIRRIKYENLCPNPEQRSQQIRVVALLVRLQHRTT